VLSFGYGKPGRGQVLTGDLVLCAPVLRREARAQGKPLAAHVAHLTVHGALHLQGHDHQTRGAAARMETLEKKILAKLGFPDPYAGDA
jgi:probable rRNA maturation factor